MLYVLECMFLGIVCANGGMDIKMYTTGESPTWKEVGVCMLCWVVASFIGVFVSYLIRFRANRKKHSIIKDKTVTDSECRVALLKSKFSYGLLYCLECMALLFLCLRSGIKREMYTTGSKLTWTEVMVSLASWFLLSFTVLAIVLICVGG